MQTVRPSTNAPHPPASLLSIPVSLPSLSRGPMPRAHCLVNFLQAYLCLRDRVCFLGTATRQCPIYCLAQRGAPQMGIFSLQILAPVLLATSTACPYTLWILSLAQESPSWSLSPGWSASTPWAPPSLSCWPASALPPCWRRPGTAWLLSEQTRSACLTGCSLWSEAGSALLVPVPDDRTCIVSGFRALPQSSLFCPIQTHFSLQHHAPVR